MHMPPNNGPGFSPEAQAPVMPTPEATSEKASFEHVEAPAPQETMVDSREAVNQNPGIALPPVQQAATPQQPVHTPVQQPVQAPVHDDSPVIADDVDVIEREWVNKAKSVIAQTRHDPHMQEQLLSELQMKYLKKRYGKEIKPAGSGE